MKPHLLLSVLSALVLAACGGGAGKTCEWEPSDNPSRLGLHDRHQRLHLMDEALLAEDRAIRYADFHRGHRSGFFGGNDVYRHARDQCMGVLFEALANHHGATPAQVRGALLDRRASVDVFVLVLFVAFYMTVAMATIRWIFMSVPADVPWVRALAIGVTALGAGGGGVVLFGLYSAAFEMLRIGNTHMSYRVARNPWHHHQGALLVGGIILFALLAAYRQVRDRAQHPHVSPQARGSSHVVPR